MPRGCSDYEGGKANSSNSWHPECRVGADLMPDWRQVGAAGCHMGQKVLNGALADAKERELIHIEGLC
eukprot:4880455-Pleurochrysis_carterae.AAC.2